MHKAARVAAGGTPYAEDRYDLKNAAAQHAIPGERCVAAIAAFYRSLGYLPKHVELPYV